MCVSKIVFLQFECYRTYSVFCSVVFSCFNVFMPLLVIKIALWNRAGHYIVALWFLLSSSFFPRLIAAVAHWMSAILPHMVWP